MNVWRVWGALGLFRAHYFSCWAYSLGVTGMRSLAPPCTSKADILQSTSFVTNTGEQGDNYQGKGVDGVLIFVSSCISLTSESGGDRKGCRWRWWSSSWRIYSLQLSSSLFGHHRSHTHNCRPTSSSGGGSSIGRCSQWQVNVNDVDSSSAAVLVVVVREAAVAAAVAAAGAVKGWKLRVK